MALFTNMEARGDQLYLALMTTRSLAYSTHSPPPSMTISGHLGRSLKSGE